MYLNELMQAKGGINGPRGLFGSNFKKKKYKLFKRKFSKPRLCIYIPGGVGLSLAGDCALAMGFVTEAGIGVGTTSVGPGLGPLIIIVVVVVIIIECRGSVGCAVAT